MNKQPQILVVEDDRDSLTGLTVLLKKNGYNVACAEDAAQAVATAKKLEPELVILDLGLPAGGGEFVLKQLRDDLKLFVTPVIILSARPAKDNADLIEGFRVTAYLEKPAGINAILRSVQNALRGNAVEGA